MIESKYREHCKHGQLRRQCEICELENELALNASMLAKQTDEARVAETEAMKLRREAEGLKCCGNCAKKSCIQIFSFSYCDKWESDCLTRKERKGRFSENQKQER